MRSSILRLCAVVSMLILVGCGSNANISTPPTHIPGKGVTSCFSAEGKLLALAPVTTPPPSPTPTFGPGLPLPLGAMQMMDATTGWGWAGDRLFRTTDGGAHWKDVTPACMQAGEQANGSMLSEVTLSASVALIAMLQNDMTVLLRTTDGGQTWQQQGSLQSTTLHQMLFITPQDGWILGDQPGTTDGKVIELFRTRDGGSTWTKVATTDTSSHQGLLPPAQSIGAMGFFNASTGWITGLRYPGVWPYVTHDAGVTWQQQTLPLPPGATTQDEFDLSLPTFFNERDGILPVTVLTSPNRQVLSLEIYTTHDGGATWQSTPLLPYDALFAFIDGQHGWMVSTQVVNGSALETTLSITSDGAQHWTTLPTNTLFKNVFSLQFVSQTVGWALSQPSDTYARLVLKTTDGGQMWTEVRPVEG